MKFIKTYESYTEKFNSNFLKWFGDSKVVKNSEPLLVYHFSDNDFTSFKNKNGYNTNLFSIEKVERHALFFTPDEKFSSQFGRKKYSLFLKIEKLFDFTEHYYYNDITVVTSELFDEFIEFAEENGVELSMEYQSYRGELKIKPEHNWKFFDGDIGNIFIIFLKLKGYDGAYFIEENEPIYTVLNAYQIKSVDNDGSWDINDDDIYS